MMTIFRIGCVAAVLSIPALRSGAVSLPSQLEGHRSGVTARLTTAAGTVRTVTLAGVGCTESMCSRVFIRTRTASGVPVRLWLDSVASVKDIGVNDALFHMRDGTEQRFSFVQGFRILYVSNPNGRTQRLDFAGLRSLEILGNEN